MPASPFILMTIILTTIIAMTIIPTYRRSPCET